MCAYTLLSYASHRVFRRKLNWWIARNRSVPQCLIGAQAVHVEGAAAGALGLALPEEREGEGDGGQEGQGHQVKAMAPHGERQTSCRQIRFYT